jgi:hypothetical protein
MLTVAVRKPAARGSNLICNTVSVCVVTVPEGSYTTEKSAACGPAIQTLGPPFNWSGSPPRFLTTNVRITYPSSGPAGVTLTTPKSVRSAGDGVRSPSAIG